MSDRKAVFLTFISFFPGRWAVQGKHWEAEPKTVMPDGRGVELAFSSRPNSVRYRFNETRGRIMIAGTWLGTFLGVVLMLVATSGYADSNGEFWPEVDVFFKLDERTRLLLVGASTHGEDTIESAGEIQYLGSQLGVHLDFTLEPIWRSSLQDEDWEHDRYLWMRVGYRHIADADEWQEGEDRGILELRSRNPLPREFWLIGRLKWDMRSIDGAYSNRYGVRLGAERKVLLGGHSLVPYFHVETLYDTRFETWNRQRYQVGVNVVITRGWRIEPYLAHQQDSESESSNVNAFGLILKYYR